MYCNNCGTKLSDADAFCPSCGARAIPAQPSVTVVRDNVAQPVNPAPATAPVYAQPAPAPTYVQPAPTYVQPAPVYVTAPPAEKSNTLAIVGFILAFFMPLAGLICSIIGYKNAKAGKADNKSIAIAGIVISALELASTLLVIAIYLFYFFVILGFIYSIPAYSATALIGGLLI